MKKYLLSIICIILWGLPTFSQSIYFPPLTGTTWDTTHPSTLNWCQPKIDSLYNFLERKNTKSFILLKDGKIVLEKYFGTFTADSIHFWASAGKSLASVLTGISIEKGYFNLNDTVSNILGNGWTASSITDERKITVKNLLTMTSGLDDSPPPPCDNESDSVDCLLYLADPNTRWAYHSGAYQKTHDIMAVATGTNFNLYTRNEIGTKIGMSGIWYNGVYYSRTRDAARFGLLTLANCIWNGDTILHDRTYYNNMKNTSNPFNLSYGYLWWLNGKTSFMAPGIPLVIPGAIIPTAPADMFCALGKYDQKIYIVPSQNMVVVRFGDSADGVASAFSQFDEDLWAKIQDLSCAVGIDNLLTKNETVYPNPFIDKINIAHASADNHYKLFSEEGKLIYDGKNIEQQDFTGLTKGIYLLQIRNQESAVVTKLIK